MSLSPLVRALVVLAGASNIAASALAAQPSLGCRTDPAVELLSLLVMLGHPDRPGLEHDYARDAIARFGPYADHAAVRQATTISQHGFDDFVAQVAARIGPPPALAERAPLYPVGDGTTSVRVDTIRALLANARDFARRTDFASFYAAHAPLYRALCASMLADSSLVDVTSRVEAFFGRRAGRHEIVLMPLMPRLGVAPPGVRATRGATLTAYVGPAASRDGLPWFRTGWSLTRVVLHEFTHQYVNAQIYARAPALARSRALLAPVKDRLWRADHIASWPGAVTETVVRACVAVMRGDEAGDEAKRAELREQRALGFALIDSIATVIEATRHRPHAPSSVPRTSWWPTGLRAIVATLDRIAVSPRAREIGDPPFDAGMAQALIASSPDSVLMILPTEERDTAMQDSLRAHITRMRDRYVRQATIVTDREALAGDYAGWTLWAVGTLAGNVWLRTHAAALPAHIDSTTIVADSAYRGHGLVFVGALPSPLDPRHAMLVTVGQRIDELTRGWWIFSADYAVVDGTQVLTRGTFAIDGGRRRFVRTAVGDTAAGPSSSP